MRGAGLHREAGARVVGEPVDRVRSVGGRHRVDRDVDPLLFRQRLVARLGDDHQPAIRGKHDASGERGGGDPQQDQGRSRGERDDAGGRSAHDPRRIVGEGPQALLAKASSPNAVSSCSAGRNPTAAFGGSPGAKKATVGMLITP